MGIYSKIISSSGQIKFLPSDLSMKTHIIDASFARSVDINLYANAINNLIECSEVALNFSKYYATEGVVISNMNSAENPTPPYINRELVGGYVEYNGMYTENKTFIDTDKENEIRAMPQAAGPADPTWVHGT